MPLPLMSARMGSATAQPAARPSRGVRVAASFFRNRVEALRLTALLACHPAIHERQLALLSPDDAAPQRFGACRLRWDRLRPGHAAQRSFNTPVPLILAGAMLGAMAGLVLGNGIAEPGGVIALPVLSALAGALLARLVQQRQCSDGRHRRFDDRLQRRLAQGQYAVVLMGVHDDDTSVELLQAMRQSGDSWCAEVPPLRRR